MLTASRSGSHRSHLLNVVKPDATAGVESSRAVIEVEQPRAAPTLAATCAWVGVPSPEAAVELLGLATERTAGGVTSFEMMARMGV